MDTHKKIREHISTLSDGALADADLELALAALQSVDGQLAWNAYHLIGDVLRAEASPALSDGFAAQLAARLDAETPPLRKAARAAPAPLPDTPAGSAMAQDRVAAAGEAAPEALAVSQAKPAVITVS
jgi:sigma-E factor negative regulatory protein RseA